MAMKNIEMFNKITAGIFAELYEAFPKPIILQCEEFCNRHETKGAEDICKATVEFLEAEGLVRFKSASGHGLFASISLTMRGFAVLKKVPNSVKPEESVGEIVVEKLKSGAFNIASDVIQNALLGMIK